MEADGKFLGLSSFLHVEVDFAFGLWNRLQIFGTADFAIIPVMKEKVRMEFRL